MYILSDKLERTEQWEDIDAIWGTVQARGDKVPNNSSFRGSVEEASLWATPQSLI